jgi:hypothetical protein
MSDPAAMDGMMAGMKTQMGAFVYVFLIFNFALTRKKVMMVPQMVIMGWINFFFQGFVLSAYPSTLYVVSPNEFFFCSKAAVPTHPGLQVDVATRDRDHRYGRPLGVLAIVVFLEFLWTQRPVPSDSRRRQL